MNVEKYIERINYQGELQPTYECLCQLHKCHVMAIPFESMDVHFKTAIKLDLVSLFDKVIVENRGGFCYELNHLFYTLLTNVGFNCTMISSRVWNKESYGPEFDHMSLHVKLEEQEYLLDVGFGDLFIEPLKIECDIMQEDYFKNYKIEQLEDKKFVLLESLKEKEDYQKKYLFNLEPRSIEDYAEQCEYKQTSPDSHFVKNTICTLPTKQGRKTILNNIFKIKSFDKVTEKEISNDQELIKILKEEFNMTIFKK